jgi:hypothetical protein
MLIVEDELTNHPGAVIIGSHALRQIKVHTWTESDTKPSEVNDYSSTLDSFYQKL